MDVCELIQSGEIVASDEGTGRLFYGLRKDELGKYIYIVCVPDEVNLSPKETTVLITKLQELVKLAE